MIAVKGLDDFDTLLAYWDHWWPGSALDLLGEALVEDTRLRLEDDETAPSGRRWAEWSPAYAATRGPEHKLLFDTGALADSIEFERRGRTIDVGSDLPYALVHQTGSRDGRLPARPYVGISRTLGAALNEIFSADFEGGWAPLGGR